MLRSILFTLYGICVGFGYAALIRTANPDEPIVAAFVSVVIVLCLGTISWSIADSYSTLQTLFLVPLLPFVFVSTMFGMAFVAVLIPPFLLWVILDGIKRKRQFRNQLRTQGRFVNLDVIRSKLDAGEGTLIGEYGHKGQPLGIWWTSDDIFSLGKPSTTDEECFAIITAPGINVFNDQCVTTYLDRESGNALLTSMPPRYCRSQRLARMFPKMKIALLLNRMPFRSGEQPRSS
jgi:hypothetical protein